MKHKLTYLTAISLLAASCASDDIGMDKQNTLSGDGKKTPIAIQTNLSASPVTRAADKEFESGDVLLAYIEAGVTTGKNFSSEGNPFQGLKTLTLTADADNKNGDEYASLYGYTTLPEGTHITSTDDSGLQQLYWDDYSSTEKDLRSAGAGIRLKYGYCYNGGAPTTALIEATGVLGWTISTNQSAEDAMKKCDLLYAQTQAPVSYAHGEAENSDHGVLVLPYSHAMSKITVNVRTGEGFSAETANFESSVLTLKHIQTVTTVDAPSGKVTASASTDDIKDVTAYNIAAEKTNVKASYQAIISPCTNLTVGNYIATISSVDGNNYNIPVTTAMLQAWSTKLTEADPVSYSDGTAQARTRATIDAAKGYLTQPGVHYVLDVVIDKQKVTVRALLLDWDQIKAEAKGEINFTADVTGKGTIASTLQASGFDVYKTTDNSAFETKSTTVTYSDSKWSYSPVIYWQGQEDKSYFRAVSPVGRDNKTLNQGVDLMWGTSAEEGKSGTEGETKVTPRTGDVKLNFEHLMSQLKINLNTVEGDAAVNLEGAKIEISNMAIEGTYSIVNGTVEAGTATETMLTNESSGFTKYVIPQTIADAAKVKITLADGTTYSVQLNTCNVKDSTTPVTEWAKGKSYVYTITLTKSEVTFEAYVKEWEEAEASGNASLDWD